MKETKPAEFLVSFLKDRFNLDKERSEFEEIINAIKKGFISGERTYGC